MNLTIEMGKSKKPSEVETALVKLGNRLKLLREKAGKSQTTFAYECDMDKPNLRKIEKAKTNPTFKTLHKLAKALNISLKELMDIDQDK
jgi:transcriptional regulator with XRE-family HTH domain